MTDQQKFKMAYVVVYLITGETLLASSYNILNWDTGQNVILIKPLSVIPTLFPEKFTLSFCKKLLFTHEDTCILKAESIQSYSYMDSKSLEFYKTALEYFEKNVDPVIDKELERYTTLLKEKKEGLNKETMERLRSFLQQIYGANTTNTIH